MTAVSVPDTGAPPRLEPPRRFARGFAAQREGMVGLAALAAVAVLALAAPLFIHPSDLNVVDAQDPSLAPPSARYLLGTDQPGRSVLLLVIWGTRPSLAIG